jgi:hypothetical protein
MDSMRIRDAADAIALAALDRARLFPLGTPPLTLRRAYLRAIEAVERLPDNQTGADKTWVAEAERDHARYHARLRRRR